jgi:hypothetical protein
LVTLRDGHCRFPGCAVAARFCDLDHVRPWPTGPTRRDNLLTLCRRHHRIKQKLGWRLRLHPDGTAHWFLPDGREATTHPVDHLAHTRPLLLPVAIPTRLGDRSLAPARGGRRSELDEPYDLPEHSPLVEQLTRLLADHHTSRDGHPPATRVHRELRSAGPGEPSGWGTFAGPATPTITLPSGWIVSRHHRRESLAVPIGHRRLRRRRPDGTRHTRRRERVRTLGQLTTPLHDWAEPPF